MPIDLKLDKTLLALGSQIRLTASFQAPENTTELIVSIGIKRPDGQTEYPVYMERFAAPPAQPGKPTPPLTNSTGAPYPTKMMGWHKAFAQIFAYTDSQIIANDLTPLQNFFVGPSLGPLIPTPLPP